MRVLAWWILAQPAADAATEPDRHVIVLALRSDQSTEDNELALRAARAGLAGSTLRLEAAYPSAAVPIETWARDRVADEDVVGVFWYGIAEAGDATVWVLAQGWDEPRVRRIPAADDASRATTFESIGLVVRSMALALDEAEPPAPKTIEPPPDPPATEAPPPEGALPVALSYVGESFADQPVWHSSIGAEIGWRPHPLFALGVGYRFVIPQWVDRAGLHVRTWRHPVELHAGVRGRLARAFALDFEALAGVEPVRAEVDVLDASVVADKPRWRAVFTVGPRVRARFFIWRTLSVDLQLAAVFALRRFDFVVVDGGRENTVLSLRSVRARAGVGLGYAFF